MGCYCSPWLSLLYLSLIPTYWHSIPTMETITHFSAVFVFQFAFTTVLIITSVIVCYATYWSLGKYNYKYIYSTLNVLLHFSLIRYLQAVSDINVLSCLLFSLSTLLFKYYRSIDGGRFEYTHTREVDARELDVRECGVEVSRYLKLILNVY